jgi:hypothetical protein
MAILMAKITIAREMITLGISVYPILALSASSWTPRGRKVEIIDPLVGIQLEVQGGDEIYFLLGRSSRPRV